MAFTGQQGNLPTGVYSTEHSMWRRLPSLATVFWIYQNAPKTKILTSSSC